MIRRVNCHIVLIELQVQCKFQQASVELTEPPKCLCTYTVGTECPVNKESTYIIKKNYVSEELHHLTFFCLFLFFVFLEGKWKRRRLLCLLLMKSPKTIFKIHLCSKMDLCSGYLILETVHFLSTALITCSIATFDFEFD